MFKKSFLVVSMFGIGAVASGVAFADTGVTSTYCKPGFYAGVEAGRGNTHYSADDAMTEIKTFQENYYTNLGVVPGTTDIDDKGTSGRIFAGYQFIPYFALEAGFTQFHKTTFTQTWKTDIDTAQNYSINKYDGEVTEHALDLVGKLTYPLQYGFGVFVKGGLGVISADRHINVSSVNSDGSAIPSHTFYTKSYQAVRPVYGAGVDYSIPNTSLSVGVSYSEFASGSGIPRASLWALGISDKFA